MIFRSVNGFARVLTVNMNMIPYLKKR